MSQKTIHIVFQVLNFLSVPYISQPFELTNDEKLLLIFLAKHKGSKGICMSLKTIAKELDRDYRNIRRSIDRLKSKKILHVDNVKGKRSHYTLLLPKIDLLTGEGVCALTNENEVRAWTPLHSGRVRPHTEGVDAPLSVKGNNKYVKNRKGRKAAPLSSDDFSISPKSAKHIESYGLDEEEANEIIDKFVIYYTEGKGKDKTSDDWNRMWCNWLDREMAYAEDKAAKKKLSEPEEKPWYHKETEHMQRGNGMAALGKILENLRPNGQGGSTNGLGTKGKGKD